MRKNEIITLPEISQLEAELQREKYKKRYRKVLRSTIYTLVVVAAVAVLIAVLFLPVLQIYGSSMTPTLEEGDIVVSVKGTELEAGDLVVFYLGNKILVKRYIAGPGQSHVLFGGSPGYICGFAKYSRRLRFGGTISRKNNISGLAYGKIRSFKIKKGEVGDGA